MNNSRSGRKSKGSVVRRRTAVRKAPDAAVSGGRLDVSLVIAVEQARYRQCEYSDSHWANLLLIAYRQVAEGGTVVLQSAIEDILRVFCVSAKAAKARAEEYVRQGAPIPQWIRLRPSPTWSETCRTIHSRGIKFGPRGEFLCLLGDGD
jgi:hypothetical protein